MNADDLERALRSFCRRRPFQSFLLEFVSGDRLEIRHPEAVTGFGELFVFKNPQRQERVFAASSVCQLLDK